jgi:glycoprotein 2-beta-D-xylosyltransferase
VDSLKFEAADACGDGVVVEETPTVLVTRYEYANMFHQMTDWYNTFVVTTREGLWTAAGATGGPRKLRFVFLDGHAKSSLDMAWTFMSQGGGYTYLKQLEADHVCFRTAIIASVQHGNTRNAKKTKN